MDREEIIKVETVKALTEILAPLTRGQRDYLYFLLMDITKHEALKMANRRSITLETHWWQDPEFKEIEIQVLNNKEVYAKEAFGGFIQSLGAKAQKVIEDLVERGLEWDSVKQGDKPYVMRAIELITKLKPHSERAESYEEMLFRVRRTG